VIALFKLGFCIKQRSKSRSFEPSPVADDPNNSALIPIMI